MSAFHRILWEGALGLKGGGLLSCPPPMALTTQLGKKRLFSLFNSVVTNAPTEVDLFHSLSKWIKKLVLFFFTKFLVKKESAT